MSDEPRLSVRRHPRWHALLLLFALTVVVAVAMTAPTTSHAVALGDVDCDGDADAVDALQILREVSGFGTSAACIADAADTDCDGDGDSVDALRILQTVAGQQVSVPPGCGAIGASLDVADVAPDLEFFGELASVHSQPVTETFGPGSETLPLTDGATIEVPAGAFPASTDVTIAVIDLLFEDYLVNPPEGRIYVLSTVGDLALSSPLVLEVLKPADSVNVLQLVDGEWLPIDGLSGPTTRILVDHFSERIFAVVDKPSDDIGLRPELGEPEGEVGGEFLVLCIGWLAGVLDHTGGSKSGVQLAFFVCTKALINMLTPPGQKADVACVGELIGSETTIQEAVNACLNVREVSGSFDESSIQAGVPILGFEVNEITLRIPKDGGTVTGDFLLVVRLDATDDEGECIVDQVAEGTFVESTLVNGELSGTAAIDASWEKVVCFGSLGPPWTFETTWSGSFDGITVTNGVVVDIGTFTASIQP